MSYFKNTDKEITFNWKPYKLKELSAKSWNLLEMGIYSGCYWVTGWIKTVLITSVSLWQHMAVSLQYYIPRDWSQIWMFILCNLSKWKQWMFMLRKLSKWKYSHQSIIALIIAYNDCYLAADIHSFVTWIKNLYLHQFHLFEETGNYKIEQLIS